MYNAEEGQSSNGDDTIMNVDLPQSLSLPTCIHLSSREWQAMRSVQMRDKYYNREGEEQFTCCFMKHEESESMQ